MAGTIRGRIDCLTTATGGSGGLIGGRNVQSIFRTIWSFLDAHPNVTRVASNYGNAASGTYLTPPTNVRGIGYWDESVNFAKEAFGVWRFTNAVWPWFLMLKLYPGETVLTGTNNAATADGGHHHIGIQAAWGRTAGGAAVSTIASMWGGTAPANGGADVEGATRWIDPGGGLYVLPRSNALYGSHAANRNNTVSLVRGPNTPTAPWAFNMWADDDSFMLMHDQGNANAWSAGGVFRYVPRAGLVVSRPYAMITQASSGGGQLPLLVMGGAPSNSFGSTTGGNAAEGGVIMPDAHIGSPVRAAGLDRYSAQILTTMEPANADGVSAFSEYPIPIYAASPVETTAGVGPLGKIDPAFLREVFNVGAADTNVALTKAAFGNATLATIKLLAKWNGITVPRTYAGATDAIKRQGVAF